MVCLLDDVRQAVAVNSLDYRAGTLESGGQRILLRADGKAFRHQDFAEIPLLTLADGGVLRVRDVARVRDGFEEQYVRARYNGRPSVWDGRQHRQQGATCSKCARPSGEVLESVRPQLPAAVQLDIWADASEYIRDRLDLLRDNAWQGLLIIVVLLALFLDLKLALWVCVGDPHLDRRDAGPDG